MNTNEVLQLMNRNKHKLTKANHGARPCNSKGRKSRRYCHRRRKTILAPTSRVKWDPG